MISIFSSALLSLTFAPVQQVQTPQAESPRIQPQVQQPAQVQPARTQSSITQTTTNRDNQAHQSLDGNWTVVCFEKNGMPVADMKDKTVTVRDGMVTCNDAGNHMKTMKVQLEPRGKLTIWEKDVATPATTTISPTPNNSVGNDNLSREAKHGSYIVTRDFAAICVHDETQGAASTTTNTPSATTPAPNSPNGRESTSAYRPEMNSKCTIFLKRADNR